MKFFSGCLEYFNSLVQAMAVKCRDNIQERVSDAGAEINSCAVDDNGKGKLRCVMEGEFKKNPNKKLNTPFIPLRKRIEWNKRNTFKAVLPSIRIDGENKNGSGREIESLIENAIEYSINN